MLIVDLEMNWVPEMQNAMNLLSERYQNYPYSNETVWTVLKLFRQ